MSQVILNFLRLRPYLTVFFVAAALGGCKSTISPPTADMRGPATTVDTVKVLSFSQSKALFAGNTVFPLGAPASDRTLRSHHYTYSKPNSKDVYRFFPDVPSASQYSWIRGRITKGKVPGPLTVRGKEFRNVEAICVKEIDNNAPITCDAIFQIDGNYYFNGVENQQVVAEPGPAEFVRPIASRAVREENPSIIRDLKWNFPDMPVDVLATISKYEGQKVREANAERLRRRREAEAQVEKLRQERAAKEAAEKRASDARRAAREAKCRRETGQACRGSGGGLIGAALRGAINTVESAGNTTGSGGAISAPSATPSTVPKSSGVQRDSSGWVSVDGRTLGRISFSYGKYIISCSKGYKPGWGSKSAFGGSFKIEAKNRDAATGVLLQACKR